MHRGFYIPDSVDTARRWVRSGLAPPAVSLSSGDFVRVWCSLFYLFPGLHPDGLGEPGDEWPGQFRALGAEAWRRAAAGEISEEQLYPSDAQWCGICDRMYRLTSDETERRMRLATAFGDSSDA
jgi:hypothetical protein